MALTPGTHISQFEILSWAGSGGMGEVYRARDTQLRREVAIKVLPGSPEVECMVGIRIESDRPQEIFVVPYPGPGGLTQISTDGGTQPRWNSNRRELFFRNGDKMMAADVDGNNPTFHAGTPHVLFEKASAFYDVHPDGRRFLMLKPAESDAAPQEPATEYHVILNWFNELQQRAPAK